MGSAGAPRWRLRDVSDDDHGWLFELHRVALGEYIEQTWGWDETRQRELFDDAFDRLRGDIIQVENRDVGLLVVEEHADELYLLRLVLLPEAQNQGLGTAIVRELLRRAADTGRALSLHVLRANPRAAALYEREGLHVVGADHIRVFMRTPQLAKT